MIQCFHSVTIVGIGMIGASIASALRAHSMAHEIVAFDVDAASVVFALKRGLIDRHEETLERAVEGADVVVLCVPPSCIGTVLHGIKAVLSKHPSIVTDVASIKKEVLDHADVILPNSAMFVPGHPIAGTEKSGATAYVEGLFEKCDVVLTPHAPKCPNSLVIYRMWEALGAKVHFLDAQTHDDIFAQVSHLPHLLAYTLMSCIHLRSDASKCLNLGGGGLRELTRIASSNPKMWQDIFLANSDNILQTCDQFIQKLQEFRSMIERKQHRDLLEKITQTVRFIDNIS